MIIIDHSRTIMKFMSELHMQKRFTSKKIVARTKERKKEQEEETEKSRKCREEKRKNEKIKYDLPRGKPSILVKLLKCNQYT